MVDYNINNLNQHEEQNLDTILIPYGLQIFNITSRERPKSAPYLRLKIEKGDPSGFVKLQLVAKNEKKMMGSLWGHEKISQKTFLMRFSNSVTVPKNVKGGPFAIL